jgi:hypothetical protein
MAQLTVKCICGEVFKPIVSDERLEEIFKTSSLAPLVLPHKDHFVTIYVDKNLDVRNVERVILIEEDRAPLVISSEIENGNIQKLVTDLQKDANPSKNYDKFLSALLSKVKSPEVLFAAGEVVGKKMWLDWRKPILQMGAKYTTSIDLIIKSEIKPILEKAGESELIGNTGIEVKDCSAPQFVVGLAQGVLNAVSASTEEKLTMKFAYQIVGDSVTLTVLG